MKLTLAGAKLKGKGPEKILQDILSDTNDSPSQGPGLVHFNEPATKT